MDVRKQDPTKDGSRTRIRSVYSDANGRIAIAIAAKPSTGREIGTAMSIRSISSVILLLVWPVALYLNDGITSTIIGRLYMVVMIACWLQEADWVRLLREIFDRLGLFGRRLDIGFGFG
ncbi:uncharacterized protein APUU_30110S [Aspergillus puulaauensis]|uniref:Uncharacterized protein n=1 Tax=Aspergillus puulaauensis TaxID=1220207 RepID=A0A7R7XID6_9EURO|nr:uncharacterized protein APUU_30110S [Aspergillus puulaauensis]BCS21885.1 hypothetical protein APUU_30110S [Aspergillus puulaauensis]